MVPLAGLSLVLADLAAKATVLLALAAVIVLLMRRASAASRHVVWTAALGAVLLLPVAKLALPVLPIRVLPPTAAQSAAPLSRGDTMPHSYMAPTSVRGQYVAPIALGSADLTALDQVPPTAVRSALRTAVSERIRRSWPSALVTLWLIGVAALLLRAVAGTFGVWRLARRAHRAENPRLLSRVQQLAGFLRVRRRVTTLVAAGESMPVTWGVVRPTVLLPSCAATWKDARLDAVLVHELAHIARLDAVSNLVARLAVALLWFHPLMWVAARRALVERERACDDRVLVHGARASRYANDLLALMQSLAPPTLAASAALAMARRSQFEGRLLAILDARANRRGLSRWSLALAAALVVMMLPVAAMQPAARVTTSASRASYVAPTELRSAESTPTTIRSALRTDLTIDNRLAGQTVTGTQPVPPAGRLVSPEMALERAIVGAAPVDFSGRWIPVVPEDQNVRFSVGTTDIDGHGMAIAQDARTFTVTAIQGTLDAKTVYNLDGSPMRAGPGGAWTGSAKWEGDRLVTTRTTASLPDCGLPLNRPGPQPTLPVQAGERRAMLYPMGGCGGGHAEWQDTYSMQGDNLRVDELRGNSRILVLYKKMTLHVPAPRVDFSGRWIPIDPEAQQARFIVGLSSIDGNGITIVQDAKTLTLIREIPSDMLAKLAAIGTLGSLEVKTVYNLDGSSVNLKPGGYTWAGWDGDRLNLAQLDARGEWRTALSMQGDRLTAEGFGPNGSAIALKRATSQAHPNFAGTWVSDVEKNADLVARGLWAPLDQQAVLTITQDDAKLTITRTGPMFRPRTTIYLFDGSPSPDSSAYYYFQRATVSTAHWDGDKLVVDSTVPDHSSDFTTVYSIDGAELKIETATADAKIQAARAETLWDRGIITRADYDLAVARSHGMAAFYKKAK